MQAGVGGDAGRGLRSGMGRGDDRRAEGVLPEGAGEDGRDLHSGGDGKGASGSGGNRRVPSRRRQAGGEEVRNGVFMRQVSGGRRRQAVAFPNPTGQRHFR